MGICDSEFVTRTSAESIHMAEMCMHNEKLALQKQQKTSLERQNFYTIRYDTKEEFNVDSKAANIRNQVCRIRISHLISHRK